MVTSDNLELVGALYQPDNGSNKVLVHVHGMAGNFYENKFLDAIAQTLTDAGIAFFAFNNRGCEYIKDLYRINGDRRNIVRIGDTFERFEECILDIRAAIDFVADNGFSEIHLSGHSLGSPKIAYYISESKDSRIKSLLFLSPADMIGLAVIDKDYAEDMAMARKMIAEGKGDEIMPKMIWDDCYLSANTFMDLSAKDSKVGSFNLYDPNDPLETLGSITLPTITIMGRKDGALSISIDQTMKRIKEAMKSSAHVETVILGDANHGYMGYEQDLAEAIKTWIEKRK